MFSALFFGPKGEEKVLSGIRPDLKGSLFRTELHN
jgi:hypothetical protein